MNARPHRLVSLALHLVAQVLCFSLLPVPVAHAHPPGGRALLPGALLPGKGTPYKGFFSVNNINLGVPAAPGHSAQTRGTCRLPVLLVKFKDTQDGWLVDPVKVQERFFGPQSPDGALHPTPHQYYHDFSDGRLELTGEVVPWITMDKTLSEYCFPDNGTLNRSFFTELIPKAAAKVDFTRFINGDLKRDTASREVDCLVILLPAEAQQISDDSSFQTYRGWTEWTTDHGFDSRQDLPAIAVPNTDVKISSYCVASVFKHLDAYLDPNVRQLFDVGTVSHEVLHMFGICDLYDMNFTTKGLGGWCLMGYGCYGAGGDRFQQNDTVPMLPCAWTREQLFLGRKSAPVVSQVAGLFLDAASLHGDYCRIPIPSPSNGSLDPEDKHYFLVEFRSPKIAPSPQKKWNWDEQIPAAGFLIWEVNDDVGTWSEFWPFAFPHGNEHVLDPGQNNNPASPLVHLCPADNPDSLVMPSTEISASHLWTRSGQVFKRKGVQLSHFNVTTQKFDVDFPKEPLAGTTPPPPPTQNPSFVPSAPGAPLSDSELLKRMDGEIDRLATVPEAVIDSTPALIHRQDLKNLATVARLAQAAAVPLPPPVSQASADKPVTPQEKALHALVTQYGTTKTVGITGIVDKLSKRQKFFQIFDLKKPKAGTPAAASTALESQFKTVLPNLGLPASVDYKIASQEEKAVQIPGETTKQSTQVIIHRPFINLPPSDNHPQIESLPVIGADVITQVSYQGSVSYVKPAGAEVPAPESIQTSANEYTADEVIARCKEKLRQLVPSSAAKWKATKAVDAATRQTIWHVEIPVNGAASIKVDVETRRPENPKNGPNILRAQ